MSKERIFLHEDLLERAIAGLDSRKPVLIYGAHGSGKATFVNKLVAEYGARNPQAVWVRNDFNRLPPEAFETIESLWRRIIIAVAETTGQDVAAVIEFLERDSVFVTVQVTTIDFFRDTFKKLNVRLILVLENVHEIVGQPYVNNFFDNLRGLVGRREFFDRLGIVISMISDFEEINNLATASPFINVCEAIPLTPLVERQISI